MYSCFFHEKVLNSQGKYVLSLRNGRIWQGTKPIYLKFNCILLDLKMHISLPGLVSGEAQQNLEINHFLP